MPYHQQGNVLKEVLRYCSIIHRAVACTAYKMVWSQFTILLLKYCCGESILCEKENSKVLASMIRYASQQFLFYSRKPFSIWGCVIIYRLQHSLKPLDKSIVWHLLWKSFINLGWQNCSRAEVHPGEVKPSYLQAGRIQNTGSHPQTGFENSPQGPQQRGRGRRECISPSLRY